MTLRVSGKNLDIGNALRTHVEQRLDSLGAKYAANITNGHVTIEREGSGFQTDCMLHLGSGAVLQVEAEAQDAYTSFNLAADRVEKRLLRHKSKLKDRAGPSGSVYNLAGQERPLQSPVADRRTEVGDGEVPGPLVIAESFEGLKEMSVSNAVRELDGSNASVVLFRRPGDERPNIVYRRADGNIGWIDPDLSLKA